MPIAIGDIDYHLSGGAANADPNASIGGAISTTQIVDATTHNFFDIVSGDEAGAGDSEYRCFYVKNNHGSLTMQNTKIWVQTETAGADSDELIGLGTSAIGGVEQTIADEDTAPAGVVFTQSNLEAGALSIGNIPAGSHMAVWVRRDIVAAASAINGEAPLFRVKCETAA